MRHARRPAFSAEQIHPTIWSGLLLGLLFFQAMRYWPVPAEPDESAPPAAFMDPYAESRRSRALLEAQEGPPPAVQAGKSQSIRGSGNARVIDGDTFVYAGERIRIADIDTPEVRGRCPEESALAARATRRLNALLAQDAFELHSLPSGRNEDRYGRKLRIVTRGGRSIGDVLVAERWLGLDRYFETKTTLR